MPESETSRALNEVRKPSNRATALTFDEAPDLLKVADVQALTRWSRNSIYEAIKDGRLPAARLGSSIRILKSELIAFLRNGDAAQLDDASQAATPNHQEGSGHREE